MNMRPPGALKHAANKKFIIPEEDPADRTGPGISGNTFPPGTSFPSVSSGVIETNSSGEAEKKGITKPEQYHPCDYKNQNLNKRTHIFLQSLRRHWKTQPEFFSCP
jgi:hypothetical protein